MWYNPYCLHPHKSQDPFSGKLPRSLLQGLLRSSRLAGDANYLLRTGGPVIYFNAPVPVATLHPGNSAPAEAPIWYFETLLAKLNCKDILGPIL